MRIGSFCMGIGGLDLAVEQTYGGELAWYSEIEPSPCVVVEREWPGVPNLGDLTALDWADVEPVDILTAGYPCQPFSQAGNRKGTSDARHLWPYIAEAVRVLRPRRVVLENVRGHLSLGFGAVLGDLAEAGFDAEWCLLRASDVGAPHGRARLFVVATDAGGERHGRGQDGRHVGRVDRGDAGAARQRERARSVVGDRDGAAAADADDLGREGAVAESWRDHGRGDPRSAWGVYDPAIRRWERILGRPAPRPADDRGRLAPDFVEWMMGYPAGWTAGLNRTGRLKALGNAVVPQQAVAALSLLAVESERAA